jgi:hypothetical protein
MVMDFMQKMKQKQIYITEIPGQSGFG